MKIPIIDISPFLVNDEYGMQASADEVRKACLEHGFFYVSNHGIPEHLQLRLEAVSKDFFTLSEDEKMRIRMELGGRAWRGYFPVGAELTSGKPDKKEGLYFGSELDDEHPKVKKEIPLHGKNLFPEKPSEMAEIVLEYINQVTSLGHHLMQAIALSLNLKRDYFSRSTTKNPTILFRIFHYPAHSANTEEWGVGEHTDYGLLTILKQDEIGGLQIKSKDGWMAAPPIKDTFVCNIGDMLDRMTNGLYRSTPHRVLNTSEKSRLSFPLFFDPDFDAIVKPIAGLQHSNPDYKDRWDKMDVYNYEGTYGEYLTQKVAKVFPLLK